MKLEVEINQQTQAGFSRPGLEQTLQAFGQERPGRARKYFSLALVDSRSMKRLNRLYRGQDRVTDVLSFTESKTDFIEPFKDEKYLGEVVISPFQARRQARQYQVTLEAELSRLLIHGLAHLCGYEHEAVSQKTASEMFVFEERVRQRLDRLVAKRAKSR